MTQEERRLVVAVTVLVLFGGAVRWFRSQLSEPWTAAGSATSVDSLAAPSAPDGEESKEPEDTEGPGNGAPDPAPIDLNRGDATSLEALPGIGKTKALAIVTWRAEHGPFRSLADLEKVPGIGPKTIERLAPLVTWTGGAGEKGAGAAEGPPETTSGRGRETSHEPGRRRTPAPVRETDARAVPEGAEAEGGHRGPNG